MTTIPNLNPIPAVTGDDYLITHDITTNRSGRVSAASLKDYINTGITSSQISYSSGTVADQLDKSTRRVATFTALSSTAGVVDDRVYLLGHTVNGVGGGYFRAEAVGSLAADGGTIAISGSIAWVREYKGYVTPQDFGAIPGTDCTVAIQAAFGGAGTTPNNTHVRGLADDLDYLISAPIKIYRSGDLLEHVSFRCEKGAKFTQTVNSKGFVFGEPAASDGLWGAGVGITARDITVEGLTHEFDDMGLWFVGCEDVVAKDIGGYRLVVVAVGNDGADACKSVKIINPTRLGDGRNVAPDAWYTVGMYRTTGFTISGLFSRFLPAALGTGGNHIILADCHNGDIYGCDIVHSTVSGNGINVEVGCTDVRVHDNGIEKCTVGIVTFGVGNEDNLISLNRIKGCNKGLDVQGSNSTFLGNVIEGSLTADIFNSNTDAVTNTFKANTYDTLVFNSTTLPLQYFMGNKGSRTRVFVPAIDFKQYLPVATQETLDTTNLRATNPAGSTRFVAKLDTGGRCGDIKNVVFHFNRLIASTSINCYVNVLTETGNNIAKAEVLDTSAPLTIVHTPAVLYSGSSFPVTKDSVGVAIFIPTAANVCELIGVSFDFIETGFDSVVAS